MQGKHKIVPDIELKDMFRVKYPDGILSADFYNKARASNHTQVLQETASRIARRRGGRGATT